MDADFEKSQKQYIQSQKLLIEHLQMNILNNENMISIHNRQLSLDIESLNHEEKQLEKYLELYPDLK